MRLFFAIDKLKDEEILIKNVSNIEIGNWRLTNPGNNDE